MDLGFVEKVDDPALLTSRHFPSKVGGRPAWLELSLLPAPEQLACRHCGKPTVFLLQLYAPLDCNHPHAYHRTLYVFMCRDAGCHSNGSTKAFVVLQCQLGRANGFYEWGASASDSESDEQSGTELEGAICKPCATVGRGSREAVASGSPEQLDGVCVDPESLCKPLSDVNLSNDSRKIVCSESDGSITNSKAQGAESTANIQSTNSVVLVRPKCSKDTKKQAVFLPPSLCIVCGCYAPKKCAKCKQVNYCSREHQIHDWKKGHKLLCSKLNQTPPHITSDLDMPYRPEQDVLLPEFEIVRETEPSVTEQPKAAERSEEERMKDYYEFISSSEYSGSKADDGVGESELREIEKASSKVKGDKVFKAFRKRVSIEPEQVSSE